MNKQPVYIVAVSGGVDSVVLLDKLAYRITPKNKSPRYIVAHFDHGIREDSNEDAKLVESLAKKYDLEFELGEGRLGPDASELEAREARYDFLRKIKEKYDADKIITAHHQDDLLETMVLNIIRGTSPRGLNPMQGYKDILRPLIRREKSELLEYAEEKNLIWNEDSTNSDEKYLRNYIRINIMPKLEYDKSILLEINKKIEELYHEIDMRILVLLPKQNLVSRSWFVSLPFCVQREFFRTWLVRCGVEDIDSKTIERLVVLAKTMPIGKKTDIDNKLWLLSEKQNFLITSK